MAERDNYTMPKNRALINRLASNLSNGIKSIYTKSYYTRPTNLADIKNIKDRLNSSINAITANNMDTIGEPNISKLLSRANKVLTGDKELGKSIDDFFSDSASMDALLQTYMQNKYLVDLDQEIDIVCKYMPKLMEALETKKDNVLSADHFSKDYIYLANSTSIPDSTYTERIKTIKDKYDLVTEVENWYMNASKYGEQFIYIVPFNRAIGKLMDERRTNSTINTSSIFGRVNESGYITLAESGNTNNDINQIKNFNGLDIELDTSGFLTEVVESKYKAYKKATVLAEQSLCEQQMRLIESVIQEKTEQQGKDGDPIVQTTATPKPAGKGRFQNTVDPSELDLRDFSSELTADGLINMNKKTEDQVVGHESRLNVPGCIVKKLKREMVTPIDVEDVRIGYLYIEVKKGEKFAFTNSIFDATSANLFNKDLSKEVKQDTLLDKKLQDISSQISRFIDDKFVNSNVDLAKEIYVMLKHNDIVSNPSKRIKITFLPAEDVEHIRFNEDPDTHRGISDLAKALFPAKLYCAMYLVSSIANMTRGYDRRVYYVKQTVDTNVAKTLLNTINQLKKSNFNIRQIENINNIIGISGSLHDYLIPTMGGDPPIQFEIMPGQNIEPPTEQLQNLEEMAINSTDVPLELIQARQSMDYAVHYTMTNSKFLKKVYTRQGIYAKFLSRIFTKIYNYEYSTNDKLQVTLPPPMFLNITNTNQIMQNTMDFGNNAVAVFLDENVSDEIKTKFTSKVHKYYLGSYLDIDVLEKLKIEAEQEVQIKTAEQNQ